MSIKSNFFQMSLTFLKLVLIQTKPRTIWMLMINWLDQLHQYRRWGVSIMSHDTISYLINNYCSGVRQGGASCNDSRMGNSSNKVLFLIIKFLIFTRARFRISWVTFKKYDVWNIIAISLFQFTKISNIENILSFPYYLACKHRKEILTIVACTLNI